MGSLKPTDFDYDLTLDDNVFEDTDSAGDRDTSKPSSCCCCMAKRKNKPPLTDAEKAVKRMALHKRLAKAGRLLRVSTRAGEETSFTYFWKFLVLINFCK